jgi:hypothetical protein
MEDKPIGAAIGRPVPGETIAPLRGARLGHGERFIIPGISGSSPGRNYAISALEPVYRTGSQRCSLVIRGAWIVCVASSRADQDPSCRAEQTRV